MDTILMRSSFLSSVSLGEYVHIPFLNTISDISEVLESVSFSLSPIKDKEQLVRMVYTEWGQQYALGRYKISYDPTMRTTVPTFATANMREIASSLKQRSMFSTHIHLLRTPVSWLGTKLFEHMLGLARSQGLSVVKISSDIQSVEFYNKMAKRFSDQFSRVDFFDDWLGDGGRTFTFVLK